jgi:hypothetical protein
MNVKIGNYPGHNKPQSQSKLMAFNNHLDTRKRKSLTFNTLTTVHFDTSRHAANEICYSSVKRRRGGKKSTILPPPIPCTTNQFPIHSPPRTPRRSRISQTNIDPAIQKSYIQTTPINTTKLNEENDIAKFVRSNNVAII